MIKKEEVKLAEEIAKYLRRNPGAGDTPEGIITCWLETGEINPAVREVTAALETLIKKGLVRKRQLPGGATVYKGTSAY